VLNKITDGISLKTKLGVFIDEQGATNVRVFWRRPRLMKVLEPLV